MGHLEGEQKYILPIRSEKPYHYLELNGSENSSEEGINQIPFWKKVLLTLPGHHSVRSSLLSTMEVKVKY